VRAPREELRVTDVILVAVIVAFFAVSMLFVRACERIIGPDVESDAVVDATGEQRAAA
jgi:hypothetical protein